MLSVASHLPFLFHIVTLLVCTGPLSLRASTHGLVINIIHSLCTCSQLQFSGKYLTGLRNMFISTALKLGFIKSKRQVHKIIYSGHMNLHQFLNCIFWCTISMWSCSNMQLGYSKYCVYMFLTTVLSWIFMNYLCTYNCISKAFPSVHVFRTLIKKYQKHLT